jgi:hypothetical protein
LYLFLDKCNLDLSNLKPNFYESHYYTWHVWIWQLSTENKNLFMQPATKNSWDTLPMLIPHRISTAIPISPKQFEKLKMGLIPRDMDYKWFIYCQDDWIYFHRSWSGHEIYKFQIQRITNESYEIREIIAERDRTRYHCIDDEEDISTISSLIDSYFSEI